VSSVGGYRYGNRNGSRQRSARARGIVKDTRSFDRVLSTARLVWRDKDEWPGDEEMAVPSALIVR
jgi:hypothetical protein